MKNLEYSINDIKVNIIKNRKRMLGIVLVCVIFGGIVGFIQGKNYEQPEYKLDDTIVQEIDIAGLPGDSSYYYEAVREYKNKYEALNAYVLYLKQVALSGDSLEKLGQFENRMLEFKTVSTLIVQRYNEETPVICDDLEAAEAYIKEQIDFLQKQLTALEDRLQTLKESPFSEGFVATSETVLLNSKVSYENDLSMWEKQLEMIQTADRSEIEKKNKEFDSLLEDNVDIFNNLVTEFNDLVQSMEEDERYDIIYNNYLLSSYFDKDGINSELSEEEIMNNRKNSAVIYAKSVAGLDDTTERFCSYVLFFLLTGIALSLLYGAFVKKD